MARNFPFEYRTHRPGEDLAGFVETIWYARGRVPYRKERIAPTGSTVAVIILGDPILQTPDNGEGVTYSADRGFLLGPHTRPTINEPLGETHAVGIVTTPVGCGSVFGVDPARIQAKVTDLETMWPPAIALRMKLLQTSAPSAAFEVVESTLRRNLQTMAGVDRCSQAVAMLEERPARPIRDIATALGISHEHLDREFTQLVGISPLSLARILRMRALLAGINVGDKVRWADLAIELGWFDQSHLIRDFKRHTGVTPSAYVAAQSAYLDPDGPGEFAGFVPDR